MDLLLSLFLVSYATGIYVYLAAFIYGLFTIFINHGAQSALPLGNVALLGGLLVTTRSCYAEYLYSCFCTSETG